jgi:intracellular septation protein A
MDTAHKIATTAASVSLPSWIVSVAANSLPVVQWVAGVVAIVAGVLTIMIHVRKLSRR